MTLRILTRPEFPECLRPFKQIKGLAIGGCIGEMYGGKYPSFDGFDDVAHAHATRFFGGPYRGWICSKYEGVLQDRLTLLHEAAHILVAHPGHTKPFGKKLLEIGGSLYPHWTPYIGPGVSTLDHSNCSDKTPKEKIIDAFSKSANAIIRAFASLER